MKLSEFKQLIKQSILEEKEKETNDTGAMTPEEEKMVTDYEEEEANKYALDSEEPLDEASPLTKLGRKIGWAGEDWTPQEFAAQIKNLSDETLLKWAKDAEEPFGKGLPNTPLAFQQKLVKIELAKRGLSLDSEESLEELISRTDKIITEWVNKK